MAETPDDTTTRTETVHLTLSVPDGVDLVDLHERLVEFLGSGLSFDATDTDGDPHAVEIDEGSLQEAAA